MLSDEHSNSVNRLLFTIIISMNTKSVLVGLGVLTVGAVAGLFIKNSIEERSIQGLTQPQLIRILRLIRKRKYIVYKQTATFALNIAQQTRNNINAQMIQQFINGPESPFKIKDQIEKITEEVCQAEGTTVDALNKSFEEYQSNEEVITLIKQQERDYQISLTGKLPSFNCVIPESLTGERFVNIQNQITKKTYLQQVAVFRKLAEYSEEQLSQNPQLLGDLGHQEKEQEEILIEEGLGTEFEPALAVYDVAATKFKNDPSVRMQIAKIEQGYQRILMKYSGKIQSKTINERDLNEMEEEVIFFDPIS